MRLPRRGAATAASRRRLRRPATPQDGRAALALGAAAALALPGRRRATGSGAGWEGCGERPHPNPGAAAGCAARGRAPAGWLAEVPAAPTPAFPQGPHALLRQGCHQSSRDAAAVLCPSLLCSSSSPERRVPPVSPQLVSPPPCGCPWWHWHRGRLLPPLSTPWGWLGEGCPWWGWVLLRCPCPGGRGAALDSGSPGPTGFVQSTLSGGGASLQGSVSSFGAPASSLPVVHKPG